MKRSVPRLEGAAKRIAKGELIGLAVTIADSNDKGIIGLAGTIVDETLHTVSIREEGGRIKQLSKAGNVFRFQGPGGDPVDVDGRAIEFRSEDRTKKVR